MQNVQDLKPVIAIAVESSDRLEIKVDERMTAPAAVVLASALVRRLARQFDMTNNEFIDMVEDSFAGIEEEAARPRLIVQ